MFFRETNKWLNPTVTTANNTSHQEEKEARFLTASVLNQQFAYTHKLVILWSCGTAWANATGNFSGTHSWGWDASFMGTVDTTDAYTENSDTSGRCFIGFDNFSILYTNATGYESHTMGDFVRQFFNFTLQGYTITQALDLASLRTYGPTKPFGDCSLRQGYWMWDPRQNPWVDVKCWMKVWGDGDLIIPH